MAFLNHLRRNATSAAYRFLFGEQGPRRERPSPPARQLPSLSPSLHPACPLEKPRAALAEADGRQPAGIAPRPRLPRRDRDARAAVAFRGGMRSSLQITRCLETEGVQSTNYVLKPCGGGGPLSARINQPRAATHAAPPPPDREIRTCLTKFAARRNFFAAPALLPESQALPAPLHLAPF